MFASFLMSCASVDKVETDDSSVGAAENVEVRVEAKVEELTPPPVEKDESADTAKADALMATLAAPIVEPGSVETEKEIEVVVKQVKKELVKKQAEPIIVQKVEAVIPVPVKEIVVAKVTPKPKLVKKAPKSGKAKPLRVGMKDLPVTYDIWILKNGDTPLTKGLVISTPTWEMGKEGYMSQIWLTLMEDKLLVNSSSDIAIRSGKLGIKIDGGNLIPFNRIAENKIGILDGEWFDKLAAASSVEIHLGFFPGKKPMSDVFTSKTLLDNLDRLVLTHRKLSK